MVERSNLAGRTTRLIGQAIDALIGSAPVIVAALVGSFSPGLSSSLIKGSVIWTISYYLFADGMQGGQSYAKRLLGMRVIDARTGEPCTFGQSFMRNLLLALLGPIDAIFILGGNHQRLGDKAAHTVVVAR